MDAVLRIIVLASGTLVEVAADGLATFAACPWLVDGGLRPEATNADDRFISACGARMRALPGWDTVGAYTCANGHSHLGLEAELGPYGAEWEREQADRRDSRLRMTPANA